MIWRNGLLPAGADSIVCKANGVMVISKVDVLREQLAAPIACLHNAIRFWINDVK